jgi:hypothetical protein
LGVGVGVFWPLGGVVPQTTVMASIQTDHC